MRAYTLLVNQSNRVVEHLGQSRLSDRQDSGNQHGTHHGDHDPAGHVAALRVTLLVLQAQSQHGMR